MSDVKKKDNLLVVGGGATICHPSDKYGCTIIEIKASNRAIIQHDEPIGGTWDTHQENHERNTNSIKEEIIKYKGRWRVKGAKTPVNLGYRDSYRDPHI